jgi:hypothetical protein
MAERTHIDKNGNTWVWEETPETIQALKVLHKEVNEKRKEQTNSQ